MFKTFTLFASIFVLIPWYSSVAQKFGDPKGFIITQNDTVAGFIKYAKQKTLHNSCQFRRSNSDAYQEYTPKDIKGFYIENLGTFEAKRNLTPFGRDAGDFFLHIVESGRATLYFLLDRANEQHFYLQKDTVFQELLKKIVMDRNESGAIVKRTSHLFRGTLKTLLSECPFPVEKVNFSEASLRKAVHKYNQCLDPQDKSEKIERNKYIGLSAGISNNTLRMESYTDRITEYGAYADISDYDQVYDFNSYTGGASIELPFGKNKHFSLLANILLTSVKLSNDKLDINYTELDFPLQLKYTVNVKNRVRLFGTGGMVFPLKLKNENRSKSIPMKLESYPYNEVGEIEPLARGRFIPPYLHFVSSVGFEVFLTPRAKIVTQLRFESLDMSRAFHIELRQQSRALIVSYLFDLNKN